MHRFRITLRWSQSHWLSPGAFSRAGCGHIGSTHGDSDVCVWSELVQRGCITVERSCLEKGRTMQCSSSWRPSPSSSGLAAKAPGPVPGLWDFILRSQKRTWMPSALENLKEFCSGPRISTFPEYFLIYLKIDGGTELCIRNAILSGEKQTLPAGNFESNMGEPSAVASRCSENAETDTALHEPRNRA